MITVAEINIAPVKSMALVPLTEARLDLGGILDDRRFYLVNSQGRLLSAVGRSGSWRSWSTSWDQSGRVAAHRISPTAVCPGRTARVGPAGVDHHMGSPRAELVR